MEMAKSNFGHTTRNEAKMARRRTYQWVDAAAVSARLHVIGTAGKLADLRWPDFSDYQLHFQHVYDAVNFAPVWVRDGQPSLQAFTVHHRHSEIRGWRKRQARDSGREGQSVLLYKSRHYGRMDDLE
jgi:hypothetical protein